MNIDGCALTNLLRNNGMGSEDILDNGNDRLVPITLKHSPTNAALRTPEGPARYYHQTIARAGRIYNLVRRKHSGKGIHSNEDILLEEMKPYGPTIRPQQDSEILYPEFF
jgi:hypothetical protein